MTARLAFAQPSWRAMFQGLVDDLHLAASEALHSTRACLPLAVNADSDAERDQENKPPAVAAPPDHSDEDHSGQPSPVDPPALIPHPLDSRRRGPTVTERLLTARELADLLGLSPATVLDRFERGDLPGFRLFGRKGGSVRFREVGGTGCAGGLAFRRTTCGCVCGMKVLCSARVDWAHTPAEHVAKMRTPSGRAAQSRCSEGIALKE